jgi:hypothetical protein
VTDNGGTSNGGINTTTRQFTVSVTAVNDSPTLISVSALSIDENVSGGVIGNVTVIDPESEQTHTFVVSDNRFEVAAGQLKLKSGMQLDFEAAVTVPLTITATDSGTPPQSRAETFTVTVRNVNDPPSVINVSNQIVEENLSGAVVGTLAAVDQDTGQTHSFLVSDARFEIVGTSLKLKAGQFLELSQGSTVNVPVTATDSGSPPQATMQSIVIQVAANLRAWQYDVEPTDTNADGQVVPLDALPLVNQLNNRTILDAQGRLPQARPADSTLAYYDVNGDGFCTPNDVLRIVNFINAGGEGESDDGIPANSLAAVNGSLLLVPEFRKADCSDSGSSEERAERPLIPSPNVVLPEPAATSVSTQVTTADVARFDHSPVSDEPSDLDQLLDDFAADVCEALLGRDGNP